MSLPVTQMTRKAQIGERVLIEVEVLSDRFTTVDSDIGVGYYRVRIPGHGEPLTVLADIVREATRPGFKQTETDYRLDRSSIAANIRTHRQAANLSQSDLAKLLGVSQASVGQWERGFCVPRMEMLVPLMTCLGVTAEALLGE